MPLRQRILLFAIIIVAVAGYSYRSAKSLADKPVHIPSPAIQVDNRPSPIEIVPSDVKLSPGESRLVFARVLNEREQTYRYDSGVFSWKVLEADGGSLRPNGRSTLYYSYTAPATPGTYHLIVSLRENPDIQKTLPIVVGSPGTAAPAPAPRKVAAEPVSKTAPAPKRAGKGSANGASLPQ